MKILLAVDNSSCSEQAVREVALRPWPPGANVLVLTAVDKFVPPAATLWYDAGGDLKLARSGVIKEALRMIEGMAETLRSAGLSVEAVVRNGDPRSVIVDEAKKWSADLIVVGSHGYTGVKRWLSGGIAQAVVRYAPCSVEVVRQKRTGEHSAIG